MTCGVQKGHFYLTGGSVEEQGEGRENEDRVVISRAGSADLHVGVPEPAQGILRSMTDGQL